MHGTDDLLPRLLEILDIICGDDGEAYAHQLRNALKAAEGEGPLNRRAVLQEAVEEMLTRIHGGRSVVRHAGNQPARSLTSSQADSAWRSGCIGVLFTSVIDKDSEVGPTLMVILTALFCEYLELSPISPIELLRGLADRLASYSGKGSVI